VKAGEPAAGAGRQRRWGHPRGVQPTSHQQLLSGKVDSRRDGLGRLAVLDDGLLLQVLELLPHGTLGCLAVASRALYCFANHEDLWKALVIEGSPGGFTYRSTWKETFLAQAIPGWAGSGSEPLAVAGIYSDLLYQTWFLGQIAIDSEWLQADTIDRRDGLSLEQFRAEYERPNRPVVLTGAAAGWPAISKWSDDYLRQAFGDSAVLAGEYEMTFDQYCQYAGTTVDEMPLYLFDKDFVKKAPALESDFSVPEYFAEDLFSVLGEDGRPDYRWLIVGPEKSGSTFHKDPNSTSAWNAVVRGSKKWIMYPPNVPPPGVHASKSGADVVTAVSLMEWFVNYYKGGSDDGAVEGVVGPGDVIFVPRGWWHCAINLEPTVAVTQNYVSGANLPHVLRFLASTGREALVSGCALGAELHERFVGALAAVAPAALAEAEAAEAAYQARLAANSRLAALFSDGGGGKPESAASAFSFGFSKPAA